METPECKPWPLRRLQVLFPPNLPALVYPKEVSILPSGQAEARPVCSSHLITAIASPSRTMQERGGKLSSPPSAA
jgi:hypothetical protein